MRKRTAAVAYMRTSSATNVGLEKDSGQRQRDGIAAYAKRAGFVVVAEFYDPCISGADPIEARPGFSGLLDRIETNGVRTVLVEDASRLARDLVTQELGILALVQRSVRVITAAGDDLTNTDDPFKVAMRQIAGAFAQLEKARLVSKLRVARERKRSAGRKDEGRKSHQELRPETVALAKRLRRASPKTGKRASLREIAAGLAKAGHRNERGKTYGPQSIKVMLMA